MTGAPRRRFAAHLGISDPRLPLLAATAGTIDPVRQIATAAACGFSGITDNGLTARPPAVQRAMGAALAAHGLTMGSFTHVAGPPVCWGGRIADVSTLLADSLAAAARVGGGCLNLILLDDGSDPAAQRARAATNLHAAAAIAAHHGVRVAVEAISRARVPGALVEGVAATVAVIGAADAANLGLILDSCHCHCTGDDMAAAIAANAGRLAAVQIADMPGRVEPGAGTLDFASVFAALDAIGWAGLIEAEFSPAAPGVCGEAAAMAALGLGGGGRG